MAIKLSEIELFMGPKELGAPDDLKKQLLILLIKLKEV